MEVEDDVFFADISKQISLLIMDDEEDKVAHCPSVTLQAFSRTVHPSTQSPYPNSQSTCRGESKGTGVFIPRSSPPSRKNRHGRFSTTSSNTKYQRQQPDKGLPHVSYNNNSKRF
ncbi:uncharacterized protein LOC132275159 [Cornus florida]|uniref:uncharacterized protein LOC132275159 n=1 Tax=Cornus florida TaxID=4283 RepID=UPI0028A1FC75|nr:uncharacterized protein LOC132275159 [Cornus florida]